MINTFAFAINIVAFTLNLLACFDRFNWTNACFVVVCGAFATHFAMRMGE